MAPAAPATVAAGSGNGEEQGSRGRAPTTFQFHPSLWGDFFLTYQPPTAPQRASMERRAEVLRERVRKMVKSTREVPKILDLTITLQRLGLDYHYGSEIDELLHMVYNSDYDKNDLYVVSLRFYLLRKNGYDVSSDVFLNFQDNERNFIHTDIKSYLSLYNASYLRIHGEEVLDEAIIFTRSCLECALEGHLESPLVDEVSLSLETPLFRRVRIFETRKYIPIYEMEATRSEVILELAKLNFNLLQLVYCEELKQVTLWWRQLNIKSNLNFVRNRIVEMHFWMTGACSEPQYSLSRIILTKMTAFITILDDIFDSYGSTEECAMLAEAVYRCNEDAIGLLPEYMKDFYLHFLKTFDSFEVDLGPDNCYRVFYLKELLKMLVRSYCEEMKWRDEHRIPKTINEHLEVSGETIPAFHLACASFVGMGDIVTKETLDWMLTFPELFKPYSIGVRLSNDIASTEREQIGEHFASTVQCYMLQHRTTMHDACKKIKELIEDSWKDMVKYCLPRTEHPTIVARTIVDFARTGDYMYKQGDRFTCSHTIKDMIASLFVEPLPF